MMAKRQLTWFKVKNQKVWYSTYKGTKIYITAKLLYGYWTYYYGGICYQEDVFESKREFISFILCESYVMKVVENLVEKRKV